MNNAGLYQPGLLEERSDEEIESEIQLNLNALIFLSKAVLPGMKTRGRGLIVNMSSLAGLVGAAYSEVYSATKHGVLSDSPVLFARPWNKKGSTAFELLRCVRVMSLRSACFKGTKKHTI